MQYRLNLAVDKAVIDRIERIKAAKEYPSTTETIRRALIAFERQLRIPGRNDPAADSARRS